MHVVHGKMASVPTKACITRIVFKAALRSRGAFLMSIISPSLPLSLPPSPWHFSSPVIGRHKKNQVVQSLVQDGATSVICVWHCTMQQRRQQG